MLTVDGLADPATADRIVSGTLGRFGRIDTLINNAGVYISKRAIHRAVIPAAPQNWQIWPVATTSESTGHTDTESAIGICRSANRASRSVIGPGLRKRAHSRRSALVTTYGRRSRAALQIGHYERVLPMLVEPAR